MANSSDIIKIGFDYRASLVQFEKETNGVFDGISEKAGKQKIVIQLDAKNDKVIDKIKELQKLKLDKFTFEFGDSGIKEQLKTFGQLENKINEIINLSKNNLSSTFKEITKAASLDNLKYGTDEYNNEIKRATSSIVEMGKKGQESTREYFVEVQKLLNLYEMFRKRADGNLFNKNTSQVEKFSAFIRNAQINNNLEPVKDTTSDIFNGCLTIIDNFIDASTGKFISLKDCIEKVISVSEGLSSINDNKINAFNTTTTVSDSTAQIDKLQNKLDELTKKYDELSSKKIGGNVSGKDIDLVDNEEFKRLSDEFSLLKDELSGLKREMQLFEEATVSADTFVAMERNVNGLIVKVDDLIDKYVQLSVAQKNIGTDKSNISSGTQIKDVFQGDKIDQATTSAKELDKTLEQVNIPTDSFDEVLSKLDLAKSELGEIVKITKQSVSDSEGKFHDSYTLKDKRGSTEIYGLSSNTEKGQLLRSNIVGYDAKAEAQESKRIIEENIRLNKAYYDSKKQEEAEYQRLRAKYLAEGKAQEEKYYADLKKSREATLKSYQSEIDSYRNKVANFEVKPDEGHSYNSWKNQIKELNSEIDKYQAKVNEANKNGGIVDEKDEQEIKNIQKSLENMVRTMSKTSAGERGWTDIGASKTAEKIYSILEKNTKMSKSARDQIKAYYNEVRSGNPSAPLNEILDKCIKIEQKEREMGRAGKSWLDIFKDKKLYSFLGQAASMFSFYDLVNLGREAINTFKEFDEGLTKISYTMDMTKSKLNDLGGSILDMASDMRTSIDDASQVAQIYANMNTTAEEIQKLSEPTLILSNLTGFDSSTVADDIQAVTQQFDILAEDSMHIADVYDYVSRSISVDYSKGIESIAEAVQVAGSTAKQAGLEYEQLAAIVGKTAEKTRLQGSQIGNGLKTIMTRLSKVGELSDEVDNETMSDASESLHKIGVEVYNLDGSYREFDVIMGELANKWSDLTDAEKSNISFAIAATRQTNLLSAVLSNFSDSMQLAEEATNANGSALENQKKYMDSFSGRLQSLETETKVAWLNIADSESLNNGISLLTSLIKLIGELVDKFGLLTSLGTVGTGAFGINKFVKDFA